MNRPMIIAAGYVLIIVAALVASIWTMQRRFIYFPTRVVPTPGEIGLAGVEPVTFDDERRTHPERLVFRGIRTIAARNRSGRQRKRRQSRIPVSARSGTATARIAGSARGLP